MRLEVVPMTLTDAKVFVGQVHRTHEPPKSGLFAAGLARDGEVVGVAIVGRPKARCLADGFTAEVTRVAIIEDVPNGCSMLYGACWRAARALGYRKLVTYILATEPGTSLRAAGWKCIAEVRGRSWSCASRPRVDKHPTQDKLRWEVEP